MSIRLHWRATAPGLMYEARGDSDRRFIVAAAGEGWTLDLLIDDEYRSVHAVDPQQVPTPEQAQRMAQEWEAELF